MVERLITREVSDYPTVYGGFPGRIPDPALRKGLPFDARESMEKNCSWSATSPSHQPKDQTNYQDHDNNPYPNTCFKYTADYLARAEGNRQ